MGGEGARKLPGKRNVGRYSSLYHRALESQGSLQQGSSRAAQVRAGTVCDKAGLSEAGQGILKQGRAA